MRTKTITPMGHLQTASKRWILVYPLDKISDNFFSFEVVNQKLIADRTDTDELVYNKPFTVEIHGDWFIEYDNSKPILVMDEENE